MSVSHWRRIVDLARQVDREHSMHGHVPPDLPLRLAEAVAQFEMQLSRGCIVTRLQERERARDGVDVAPHDVPPT